MHFWSFWAKYCHFLHILSNVRPKNNVNKVPRWVFRDVGNKTIDFSSKEKDFLPQNDQIWPKIGIFDQFGTGHAGLFNALLWVGWWLWRAGCISQDTCLRYVLHLCTHTCITFSMEGERDRLWDPLRLWQHVWLPFHRHLLCGRGLWFVFICVISVLILQIW